MATDSRMYTTNIKNQRERHRHRVVMAALKKEEKLWEVQSKKDLESTRSELTSMMAYSKVYRSYSFYKGEEKNKKRFHSEQRLRTPVRVSFKESINNMEPSPNRVQTERLPRPPKIDIDIATARSADGATKGILRHNLTPKLETLNSSLNQLHVSDTPVASFGTGNVEPDILVVHRPKEAVDEQEPKSGRRIQYMVVEAKNFARPKLRSTKNLFGAQPPTQRPSVFPEQCRNTFTLRRLMDEKANRLIKDCSAESKRKREVKKILAKVTFPKLVSRDKTTSAIFRDYQHIKDRRRRRSPSRQSEERAISFDVSKVLKLPPMSRDEKVSMLHRSQQPVLMERSNTVV